MQKELNEIECWKDIPLYEGKYQVSDLGRVRILDYRHTGKVKVMRTTLSKGYYVVSLCKNGKQKQFLVHRLVVITFIGPIPPGMVVNHLNEIKTDNRLANLEICTVAHNNNWGTRKERAGKAIAKAMKGRKLTAEHREKISASQKGRPCWCKGKKLKPHSEETKAKMSAALKGRKHSSETRAKISAARKGQTPWNKGKPQSEETKKKLSAAVKAYYERERSGINNL